ncbi:MAG: hypothetical protein ACD_61C00263G0002 [uncultured bacterium]|uniref:SCO-spondin n=2 Tax=Microgenomates group TaxID=1794810 RepID=A0A0G1J850_9BACT|nr:MAG: hypothetical protein ACD_61C00263G0002 [uncultured bacterium]KKT30064.1 MAG: SCO-spondin [Microgenomates group bacterium GW2011_GWC1_44_10]KKT49388.1 MAG: SCO-spondin [Candidatus Collierbacteria bacterium GW2011_GWC2_44_18]KKT67543.1 MAG: SCO-spondin [Candidatus Woesebacteria bacterium GW2011_GWA2_44_33]
MEDQGITTLEPVPSARLRPIFLGFVTFFSGILVGLIVSVYLPLSFLSKVIRPQVFVPPTDEVEKNLLPSEGLSMGIQINTCCSCPRLVSATVIGKDGWVLYEKGKNYASLLPEECKMADCAPCPPLETKLLPCQYNDKTYQDGEMVPVDKCNTCTCLNGQVACTLMACE